MTVRNKPLIDTTVLDEADITRLNKEAASKVLAERKRIVAEQYLEQQKELERAKFQPAHELVEVVIDLPGYTKNMLIDGVYYNHGDIVQVPRHMGDSIRDNMARAWHLEHQMGNPNLREYSPVKEASVSALSQG